MQLDSMHEPGQALCNNAPMWCFCLAPLIFLKGRRYGTQGSTSMHLETQKWGYLYSHGTQFGNSRQYDSSARCIQQHEAQQIAQNSALVARRCHKA